jgi:protein phosphatase
MRTEVAGLTHVGMRRSHNEDNLLLLPEQGLFCVADGMGGHSNGEIAARIAVDEVGEFYRHTAQDPDATWPFKMDRSRGYDENRLVASIKLANQRILERAAADHRLERMGTTVAALSLAGAHAYVAHVGDSRVYSLREGVLRQLTDDHSLLNDVMRARKMTQEEIDAFPHKNVIVRALGMKDAVQVDVARHEPQDGELYLLCSDGLTGMLSDAQIRETLVRTPDLRQACERLVEQANAAGGTDNITVVLVRCRK